MEKIVFIIVFLFASATSQAEIPENMPQSIYDQIIQQVIHDKGYLDMSALQESIAQWQLQQPLPITDGQLLETGNCSNCLADNQGTDNQFKKPRKVKVKAKKRSNGKYPSVLKIKWKKPKKLGANIHDQYKLSHYLIYISKDGQSYEVLRKEARYKKNGKLKNKQKIKFKDRTTGSYSVQVQAVYQQKTTNKNAKNPANKASSIESFSPWSPKNSFKTENKYTTVGQYTGAIHSCLNDNGFADATLLTAVDPSIDCTGYNLQNADINLMANLTNIRSIIIANNPAVINISALSNLNYLEYLGLSNNPNITLPDFSQFEELVTLKLANMGLATVPNLSSNDLLTALDLNDNAITSGFDLLPSALNVLEVKGSGSSYCQINSIPAESIVVDAENLNLADCASVVGLKFIGVTGGNFSNTTQDISAFTGDIGTHKLCGLNITNTNLERLDGMVPIEVGFHLNNNNLIYVQPLFDASNNVIPMANFASINSNNLLCSNRFKLAEYNGTTSTTSSSNTTPNKSAIINACGPIIAIENYYQIPSLCKPDPLTSIDVYQDLETQKHYITWKKDPSLDYELMGINEYEIKGYDSNGYVISQRRVATDSEQVYVSYFVSAVKYSISACNENICGYEIEDSQFSQGLSRVKDLTTSTVSPKFKFEFKYNFTKGGGQEISNPEEFRIVANFPQSNDSTLLATIPVPPNSANNSTTWQSPDFNYLDIIGNSFKIYACNALLGCGTATDITVSFSVSSANLPTPNWVNISKNQGEETQIKLEWSLPGTSDNECNSATTADLDCVDYIEINEWQPKIRADSLYHQVSGTYDKYHRIYYIDKVDAPLVLSRLTYSGYDFDLRSCHRDRENGDICSAYSGGFQQLDSQDPNCTTTKTCNLGVSDIVLNRADIRISSLDTAKPINVNWYFPESSNFNFSQIVWEVPDGIKPDYFHLKSTSSSGGHCSKSLTVDYADKIITNKGDKWVTERDCLRLKRHVTWTVQSCFNGVGCSSTVAIELNGTTPEIPDPVIRSSQNTNSSTPINPAQAGPGGLNPGMWWNEELAGSGWHFFFANELGNATASSYDLIGYWYTYREMNGVWTPTWIEAKMIQKTEVNGDIFYDGSLKYYNNSPSFTEMEAGKIQLVLKANKQHATLKIKPNIGNGLFSQPDIADLGPYTQEGDEFTLEIKNIAENFIEINNSAPNNDDHHSGVWHHKNSITQEFEVSVNTWIENGFEYTVFATFDTDGVPIWLTAVNICTEPNGSCNSHGGYFVSFDSGTIYGPNGASSGVGNLGMVSYGFNPLAGKPLNHSFGSIDNITTNYHGNAGRCLNLGTAQEKNKKGSFWMNLIEQLNYPVSGDDPAFTRTVSNYGNHAQQCNSPADLDKVASLHNIDFKIEGQADTDWVCDPDSTGDCIIDFTWYTDDDFPSIQPYYSIDNGQNYALLSDICSNPIPSSHYIMPLYTCDFTSLPGDYTFQLRKAKYNTSGGTQETTEIIAESKSLVVESCDSSSCLASIPIVLDQIVDQVNQEVINQPGAGPIPGSGGVSGGAATYNLPLAIPPGRNGMTPSLSVNYSSKGGNGTLGLGWSISAASSIYRCPQTLAQDTKNHAVDFSHNDRLCLDGQRLMKVSTGTYWATNAEYRTEQESFTKITKKSATVFEVKTKSGRTNTYTQQGIQKTTWQLTQETDTFANNIKYNYLVHGANEWLLDEILYTGTATASGNRSIKFNYFDRVKGYSSKYLSNEKTESTKRLENIIITTPNGIHRSYGFHYIPDNPENLLLLDFVKEAAIKDGISQQRTVLNANWQGDQSYALIKPTDGDFSLNSFVIDTQMITQFNDNLTNITTFADIDGINGSNNFDVVSLRVGVDINGDGSKEILAGTRNELGEFSYMLLFYDTNGSLLGQITLEAGFLPTIITNGLANADFNADGITDMLFNPLLLDGLHNYQIAIWKGEPFPASGGTVNFSQMFRLLDTNIPAVIGTENNRNMTSADFNNDGYPDLVYTRLEEGNDCFGSGNICRKFVYYRKNLGIDQSCAIPDQQPPCTHNPAFSPEKLITTIDHSGFSSAATDTVAIKDLNQDGFLDILVNNGRKGLVKVEFFDGIDVGGNFNFVAKNIADLGIFDRASNNSLENTYYQFTDINGDGLEDFLFVSDPDDSNSIPSEWQYQLNTGKLSPAGLFSAVETTGVGGNENGLPDTEPQCELVEYGGDQNIGTTDKCAPRRNHGLILTDLNSDGINDILLPNPDDILIDICMTATVVRIGVDWVLYDSNNHPPLEPHEIDICADPARHQNSQVEFIVDFNSQASFASLDRSVYGHNAFIIEPKVDGNTIKVGIHKASSLEVPTIYKKIGSKNSSGDLFGDGDQDYTSRIVCPFVSTPGVPGGSLVCDKNQFEFDKLNPSLLQYLQTNYNASSEGEINTAINQVKDNIVLANGASKGEFFITRNDSTTAGLIASVSKPSQNLSVDWTYQPLSTDPSDRSDFPLYTVPDRLTSDSYVDEDELAGEHFYFNSSMYVVSEMSQTNNYGHNSLTEYAYQEAVYNNQGRGFQGFRKISVRTNPDEQSGSIAYETLSESTFHQVFPYAGKLEKIEAWQFDNSDPRVLTKVQQQDYDYIARTSNQSNWAASGVHYHPLINTLSQNFELNNGNLATKSEATLTNDVYGNITSQTNTIETYDATNAPPVQTRFETVQTINEYNTANTSNWWIDKLAKTTVTKSATGNSNNHTSYSEFYWKTSDKRELDCQYTYIGDDNVSGCTSAITNNNTSKNTFIYDTPDTTYGNITKVTTTATNRSNLAIDRTVDTVYSTDGYFPELITKDISGANLSTSFTYDPATGQVTQTIAPDGNYVDSFYDAYGFKIRDEAKFWNPEGNTIPVAYTSLRNCNGNCSEQSIVNTISDNRLSDMIEGSPQLTYYTEQRQNGQPRVITWYDNANNPVLTKTYHSDNTGTDKYNYVVSITTPAGSTITTQPFMDVSSIYPTVSLVDPQGRVIEKHTKIGDLSDNSIGDCTLITDYDHQGGFTQIDVTRNQCTSTPTDISTLSMSRTYDATGKLLSTTDADVPLSNTVNYEYDASGNPKELIDAQGNIIYTSFDALGRKQSVDDPNMGIKSFNYNGFGEVIKQQVTGESYSTYFRYDNLGRITDQYSNVDNALNPVADVRSYIDQYIYNDTRGGVLESVERQSNKFEINGNLNTFSPVFIKIIEYDNQNRMRAEITRLPAALTLNSVAPTINDFREYKTEYYYDGIYNRLKQVIYDYRYSIANTYTRHGSLKAQIDVLKIGQEDDGVIMEVTGWNFKGQETSRVFNKIFSSTTQYYPSTGQVAEIVNYSGDGTAYETLSYQYDPWGNIKKQLLNRDNNIGSEVAEESFIYDSLHRLKNASITSGTSTAYTYNGIGNITSKSDFSTGYNYAQTGNAGPNAVTSAALVNGNDISYEYDNKGNRISDDINGANIATYQYDYNNLLVETTSEITGTTQTLEFNYGPDNQRYRKYDFINKEITLYANKDYEAIYKNGAYFPTETKYYLTSYLTVTRKANGIVKRNFMQKDRLGSTTQILDETGIVLHTKSYDAFGKPRNGDWSDMTDGLFQAKLDFSDDPNGTIDITKRGFTDHEHLDEMQLIHMNGRMYDYNNGRFLSVDPFIASPTSTQALNPYTYINNNPLSGVDPSGYLPVLIPVIVKAAGWASAAWGAAEAGEALGTAAAEITTGNKSVGQAATDAAPALAKAVIAGGVAKGALKVADKLTPDSVKNKISKALSNGNKNKSINTKSSSSKSISDKGSQKEISNKSTGSKDTETSNKPGFIVSKDGAVVHNSTKKTRESLDKAGFKGEKITNKTGTETGTKHAIPDKKMDVRVMNGNKTNETRVVTSSSKNPKQNVNPTTGQAFKGNVSKKEQRQRSHIKIEKED